MSYPGYPGYPPGGGSDSTPPYPHQGAPYGQGGYPNSAPYPTPYHTPYPPSGGVFPPSLGFSAQAPVYMPPSGGFPPPGGGFPPGGFPPHHGGFPPSAFPPGTYPPGTYPPGAYPQPPTSYPHAPNPGQVTLYPHEDGEEAPEEEEEAHDILLDSPEAARLFCRQGNPTLVPADPFNPTEDAEALRAAMKGFGTDEKAIINVIARRTNEQRMEIAVQFKTLYGKDLIRDLRSETSGNFKKLIVSLMTPLPQLYAKQINDAISGLGTDEEVLIEVFCTKTNSEIRTIRMAYEADYGNCLEEDLMGDTSGTFRRLMISLCNASRDESMEIDMDAAIADAQALMEAGELQWGTDESTFNKIMCQRNYVQLRLIFEEYEKMSGKDIEDVIKSEFSGNSERAFLALVRSIRNQPLFFAKSINSAIAGFGTKDNKLIRITATRCEIDMADIKEIYEEKYGESLADAIRGDTSGDYKRCLLCLIGEY